MRRHMADSAAGSSRDCTHATLGPKPGSLLQVGLGVNYLKNTLKHQFPEARTFF